MPFSYNATIPREDLGVHRALRMIPGLAAWITILGILGLSLFAPVVASAVVVTFLYYWIFRLSYYAILLFVAFARLRAEQKSDWMQRIRDLATEATDAHAAPDYRGLVHLLLIPVYSEPREVFEAGIRAARESEFPASQIIVCLAVEERAPAEVKEAAAACRDDHRDAFHDFLIVEHPADLPGEGKVKGANVTYAARQMAGYLDAREVPYENVIVSCFDADTVVGPDSFACLSYTYLTCPDRTRASYQPIPVYGNNLWRVPVYARVLEMGATVFQMIDSTNHELLISFSSHSISFRALVDVGYWPTDIVSDDSSIYWKALIHFQGDFRVVPLQTTVSMDAPEAGGFWPTLKAAYKQKRRWAWGVENVPLAVRGISRAARMPRGKKFKYIFRLFDLYYMWATWPFLLAFAGWLPAVVGRILNLDAIAVFSLGGISGTIFQLASVFFLANIAVTAFFALDAGKGVPLYRKLLYPLEWVLLPISTFLLTGLPALDAQTRLMLGRSMSFSATSKRRDES